MKASFNDDFESRLRFHDCLAGDSLQVQVCGAGRAGGCGPKCLAQVDREVFGRGDIGAVLGNRRKRIDVVDLLVGVSLLVDKELFSGQRDDRGAGEVGVLQTGRQVDGADGLGHAEAWTTAGACVGVGHVGSGFFAVGLHALDPQFFHLHKSQGADIGHEEDVGDSISMYRFGDEPATGHARHW